MKGRKRLPTQLKALRGTLQKCRITEGEPKPEIKIPTCPKFLNKLAKAEWRRVASELFELGILTRIDRASLAAYAQDWALLVEASEIVKKEGLVVTIKGSMGQEKKIPNPALSILKTAKESLRAFAVEFGMSPSSRGRLSVTPKEKTLDPMEELRKRKAARK